MIFETRDWKNHFMHVAVNSFVYHSNDSFFEGTYGNDNISALQHCLV